MKKKLIFCLCIALSIITFFATLPISAYTYDCTVEVTSSAALVVNVDTGTVVYDKNSNASRYSSYLSNIMTFIIVRNNVTKLDDKITIKKSVLDKVKNSDNSLKKFTGMTLTVNDLLHYLLLTDGTDAAFVLADYVSKGKIEDFVSLMNKKAVSLGCTKTKFSSPGVMFDTSQVTTCADMYKIVKAALDIPEYKEISSKASYMPTGYKKPSLEIQSTNSLIKKTSPYYFKYINSGKFGLDKIARGNIAVSSVYHNVSYVCIIMGASTNNEHNAFTEVKQLLSWAYTKLGNKVVVTDDDVIGTLEVNTSWGTADIDLTVSSDIERTMPGNYNSQLLTFEIVSDMDVKPPVFVGQNMGTAQMYYDGQFFEEVNLASKTSCGVSLVGDTQSFIEMMFDKTINPDSGVHDEMAQEPSSEKPSEIFEAATKEAATKPAETQTPTQTVDSTQAVQ